MDHLPQIATLVLPFVAILIPVVALLTKHQQRMAEILNRTSADHNEIASLREEISELKRLMLRQGAAPGIESSPVSVPATPPQYSHLEVR